MLKLYILLPPLIYGGPIFALLQDQGKH
jgi:hypothetical protein